MTREDEVRDAHAARKKSEADKIRKMHRARRWAIVARCALFAIGIPAAVFVLYAVGAVLVQALALYGVHLESPWLAIGIALWHAVALFALGAFGRALRFK